jgi:SHS2 domain-containing protein
VFRWVEHTGELELEIEAASAEEAFAEALAALAELMGEGAGGPPQRRRVAVEAADRPALLAAWLEELVFLAETERLVPERAEELALAGTALQAVVVGRTGDPPHLVKAVTYHRLELAESDGGWHGRAVLDV